MNRYIIIIVGLLILSINLLSQTSMISKNSHIDHIMDRLEIKSGIKPQYHSSIKYYQIGDIVKYAKLLRDTLDNLTYQDLNNINYILRDNIDWANYIFSQNDFDKLASETYASTKGFLKYFYKAKSSFNAVHHKNFFIKIDPVINFSFGNDFQNREYNFTNTRGFKISGLLDKKIYFYTSLFETQRSFLPHIDRKINRYLAVPGQAFYKKYESSFLNGVNGYDYLNAQAYIGFKLTKSLNAQIGHGKFFIGNGIRSLFLSDYAHNYYYLKFDTRVWKFHYTNIFAEMLTTSSKQIGNDILIPKKYMAAHYLSYKVSKNFEVGLYETIIFNRDNHFELQYLNPLIIFRTVEQFLGSPDNVLVGIDWKYNFIKKFSFYGQFLLDEFNFSRLIEDNTWWANKYGMQLGLKYIDVFGLNQLDLQVETNITRPYTYAHRDSLTAYSHYNQPLAHPLGANFKELILLLQYTPINNLSIKAKGLFAVYGDDKDGVSWGGNILISQLKRPKNENGSLIDYGYHIGNGLKRNITQYSLNLSYMFYHNYYFDIDLIYRNEKSENPNLNLEEFYIGSGLKININNNSIDY